MTRHPTGDVAALLARLRPSDAAVGADGADAAHGGDDPDGHADPPGVLAGRALPARLVRAVLVVAGVVIAALVGLVLLSDAGSDTETVPVTPVAAATADVGATGMVAGPSDPPASSASPTSAGPVTPGTGGTVVVHVVGRVRRPGLVTLEAHPRVADAVRAAGGATRAAALNRINLARPVSDGEQILVPGPDDPLPAAPDGGGGGGGASSGGSGGGSGGAAAGATVNLNTATAADLDGLPGVGPVTAGRILDWRREHQRFSTVDELAEVPGIGPKTLERLRPLVTV